VLSPLAALPEPLRMRRLALFFAFLCVVVSGAAAQSGGAAETAPPATLRVLNRDIVTLRATVLGTTPQQRVERITQRLRALTPAEIDAPFVLATVALGELQGVQIQLGVRPLLVITAGDLDAEHGETLAAAAEETRQRLVEARTAYHASFDGVNLRAGLLRLLIDSALLAAALWLGWRATGVVLGWLIRKRDQWAAVHAHMDWRELAGHLLVNLMRGVQAALTLSLLYFWLTHVLAGFAATEPLSEGLREWLIDTLVWLSSDALASLPGLATVAVVLTLTHAFASALDRMFSAVREGRLQLPGVHPETSAATRRLVVILTWGVGLAVAYPFLPGASSDAFKGLSVLFGLMITLGSASVVAQAMSGLVVVYSRALRKGDFVRINDVEGVVTEVASLATKLVNLRNEEVTIPNSVLISNPIHNYSKLAGSQGTLLSTKVTIGYDAPWRQVHALLKQAAAATDGIRSAPAPVVYQRALADFYAEYELLFGIDRPLDRVSILSRLHAAIQDAFNAAGVQIMSPHFVTQPAQPVLVPRAQWDGAAPPAG
jgi:small-conductance mechanosensitive channel